MVEQRALAYDPAASYDVDTEEIEYRRDGNESWLAQIYQPKGAGPFPALLDVHGGAWNRGSRNSGEWRSLQLAASGIVVAAVDFRLAPQHPYPAQVADVNYATRWLKACAGDFNAQPHSVGLLGSSSGGNTALLSAMRPHDPRYAALLLSNGGETDATVLYLLGCWPIVDPYARYFFAKDTGMDRHVASTEAYFLTQDAMQEGNPHLILQRGEQVQLPPMMIVQGTADQNLPVPVTEQFAVEYRRAGGEMHLELFPGMPHLFGLKPGPEADRAVELIKGFVARQLNRTATAR